MNYGQQQQPAPQPNFNQQQSFNQQQTQNQTGGQHSLMRVNSGRGGFDQSGSGVAGGGGGSNNYSDDVLGPPVSNRDVGRQQQQHPYGMDNYTPLSAQNLHSHATTALNFGGLHSSAPPQGGAPVSGSKQQQTKSLFRTHSGLSAVSLSDIHDFDEGLDLFAGQLQQAPIRQHDSNKQVILCCSFFFCAIFLTVSPSSQHQGTSPYLPANHSQNAGPTLTGIGSGLVGGDIWN
jgi:hypothetical protein